MSGSLAEEGRVPRFQQGSGSHCFSSTPESSHRDDFQSSIIAAAKWLNTGRRKKEESSAAGSSAGRRSFDGHQTGQQQRPASPTVTASQTNSSDQIQTTVSSAAAHPSQTATRTKMLKLIVAVVDRPRRESDAVADG